MYSSSKASKIAYLKVIYPEDDFGFHELIEHILSQPIFEVFTLSKEKADVEEIAKLKPDLIVMDLRRRKSPNFDLHQKIIEADELKHRPMLIITEKGYDSTPLGFSNSEIDDYVCYPLFDKSAFLACVNSLLQRAQSNT